MSNYNTEYRSQQDRFGLHWYSILWRILRPILIFFTSLFIVLGILSTGYNYIKKNYFDPVNIQDTSEIVFSVKSGASLSSVSAALQQQGLVRNKHVFKYYSDFQGLGQKIQAGEYVLSKNMTLNQIANILSSGDGKPITYRLTIIPGQNIEEIATMLAEQKYISNRDEFLALCKTGEEFKDYYFLDELFRSGQNTNRKYLLEGYLAPNTYELYTNSDSKTIISKLLSQTDTVFSEAYYARASELNITIDEILTLASMIEKEAKTADFQKVSAIFHNRLRQNMKLESDVTIHYVSNVRRMALTREDLSINSPYNTYQIKGLPIGPICSPSPNAIYAALFPDTQFLQENYLYFCSKSPESGELHFSKTLKEHEKAVKEYAPLWEAFDRDRGL